MQLLEICVFNLAFLDAAQANFATFFTDCFDLT